MNNEFTDWFDANDDDLLVMECEDIAREAFFAGTKSIKKDTGRSASGGSWKLETIENARKIYQEKNGGDYFENGEIFKKVLVALREALEKQVENENGTDEAECRVCGHVFNALSCPYCNSLRKRRTLTCKPSLSATTNS